MKVAVVGATGLVGTQMIRVLEERDVSRLPNSFRLPLKNRSVKR